MVKDMVDRYCQDPAVTLIYVTHYQEELPRCIDHSIYLPSINAAVRTRESVSGVICK